MFTYLLAIIGAAANASSSVLQRKANRDEPDDASFNRQIIIDLLHRPVWFAGFAAVIVGFLCQAAALGHGALAVVEPILILELPFTLGLATVVFHGRLRSREWVAAAALTMGLALVIASLAPTGGTSRNAGVLGWALGTSVTVAVVALLVTLGRNRRGAPRAAYLGLATGVSFGMTAALMTAMAQAYETGWTQIFVTWQTYAMVASGLTAMFLLQNALQAGTLVAAQPAITLSDPVVSILWGVLLFGERLRLDGWLAGAAAGALLIAWGTVRMSRSPLLAAASGAGTDPSTAVQAAPGTA